MLHQFVSPYVNREPYHKLYQVKYELRFKEKNIKFLDHA